MTICPPRRRPAGRPAPRHRRDRRRRATRAARRGRARRRQRHRRHRARPDRARRHVRDRRVRRHRHARHGRHAPAHVADRDARLRRRLDPHAVLRLVLPRARHELPAAGRPRRQPAVGARRDRRGRHDDGRLVARPAHPRARGGGARRARLLDRAVRARVRRHLRRTLGVVGRPGRPAVPPRPRLGLGLAAPADGVRRHRRPDASRSAPPSRWPASWALPVTTHAGVWGATNDDGIRLMHEGGFMQPDTVYVHAATLSDDSYQRIAATGGSVSPLDRERAELRAGLPAVVGAARARHPGVALGRHQRVVLERPLRGDALDPRGGPGVGAREGARGRRDDHPRAPARRARGRLGDPRRRRGARHGRPRRLARGRQAGRRRADQERPLPHACSRC